MAKKALLRDHDNIEILPITRGELVLDSSGKEALHSNEFLASNSRPGLMSAEDKAALNSLAGGTIDSDLSTTSTNPVQNKVVTNAINSIKTSYLKSATVSTNTLTIVDQSNKETKFYNTTYGVVTQAADGLAPKLGTDASATIGTQADEWVLTSTKGSAPTWRKLPANAFKNDNNNTTYTFASGNGGFTVTPSGGTSQTVSIGKPATAGTADKLVCEAASTNSFRHVWFSYDGEDGRLVYDNDFTYNPATNVLNVGSITGSAGSVAWGNITGRPDSFTPSAHNHATSTINALTGYTKATAIAAIATTDSLNTALGKLELKADTAYTLVAGAYDGDGTIENLSEILKVLEGIKDTETIQAIVGKYLPLTGGTLTGALKLDMGNSEAYSIHILKNGTVLSRLACYNYDKWVITDAAWSKEHLLYHTGNLTKVSQLTNDAGYLTSLPSHVHTYIQSKDNYTFTASTLPNSFDWGVSAGFVADNAGYGSYGSVLTVRTYTGGGGTLQLYAPYSKTYGGTRLKARFGDYDKSNGNSWTDLKEIAWTSDLANYVPLIKTTTAGCNSYSEGLTLASVADSNAGHTGNHSAFLTITSIGTPFQLQIPDSSVNYVYKRYKSSGSWSAWSKLSAGYADSAGNSDTIDNYHASSFYVQGRGEVDAQNDLQTIPKDTSGGWKVTNSGWTGMVAVLGQGHSASNRGIGFLFKGGQSSRINLLTQVDNTWGDRGVIAYTSDIPTVTNYYWADQLITSSAKSDTNPTFANAKTTGLLTVSTGGSHCGIKAGNTYINSINSDLILQNNGAIRFGTDSWDYNYWAGLKYVHSSKTISLGLADGTHFTANNAQSGGTMQFPGIGTFRLNGTIHINPPSGSYVEGIRMHPSSAGWTALVFCGDDNTADSGTSAKTWGLFTNGGNLYINKNNSSVTTGYELCNVSGNWGIGTTSPSEKLSVNGAIYTMQPSTNRRAGIIGTYDPNRAAAIWSMGSSYQIAADGTTLGNLYGAAYVYYGSGYTFGAGKSNGHSFVWCQNGTPTAALGNNIWTSGVLETGSYLTFGYIGASFTSDIRSTWRQSLYGNTTNYSRFRTVRTDVTIDNFSEIYGSGITWATADTQGYLSVSYSSGKAFIGGGNGDKLNWSYQLLHSGNYTSYALKNYGADASRPNGGTFTLPGGVNPVSMRSNATSGADIGIFYLSDDNAFVCNSSDNGYLFATFDTDKTANFSTSANAAFAVLSDHAGIQVKGAINSDLSTGTHLAGNQGTAIINSTASAGYNMLAKMNSTNGVFTMGMYSAAFNLYYTKKSVIDAGTNSTTHGATLLDESGNSSFPGLVSMKSLSVINDSCNNSTDALAYFQHRSNNDWTVKIDSGSYDYGLHINATGNNALLVGPGAARFTGSMIVGADATPSYTLDVRGKIRATNRIYANEWIQFDNGTGLYWPNTYGAHFYPNETSTYG